MKETINYYYKVYPDKIYEINSGVYFYFNDFKYYFIEFTRTKEEINLLVKISNDLYNKHVLVNTFILTKDNNYFVELNDKIMILLRVNSIESDTNTLKDLIYFNNLLIIDDSTKTESWASLWSKKVDIFESEMNNLNNDYLLVQESIDYYIGLTENAISYFNLVDLKNVKLSLCHKRLNKYLYSGLINNPINFMFDYEVRDIAEYIKTKFFTSYINFDEIESVLNELNRDNSILLFCRLMYPSYYFDEVKKIMEEDYNEKNLKFYIDKVDDFENLLFDIYEIINKKYNIPPISWLDNKN